MVGLTLAKLITSHTINDGKSMEIAFEIDPIDEWKFMRWIELMNAYDSLRKSSYEYYTLQDEICEDYNKDYRKGE